MSIWKKFDLLIILNLNFEDFFFKSVLFLNVYRFLVGI